MINTARGTAADAVHYQTSIQPIEFMQAVLSPDEFVGFLKGNIIKYVARCGRKDNPLQEAQKVRQYATWLQSALANERIDPRA